MHQMLTSNQSINHILFAKTKSLHL